MAEPDAAALGRRGGETRRTRPAARLGTRLPAPLVALLAAVLLAASYALGAAFFEVEPGSAWSLAYGVGAAALLVLTAAYGVRRRMMPAMSRWRWGRAAGWLTLHLWGGGLFLLLMLLHSGLRWPAGAVTQGLWLLGFWTVATGAAGRLLQLWIPRLLTSGLTVEVLYERIPELVEELRGRAERLAGGSHEAIQTLYEGGVATELAAPRRRWLYFMDVTGGIGRRLGEFRHVRRLLPEAERERLDELEQLLRTKLEIDAHYTLQRALRWWPVLHVPAAVVLVALLGVHLYLVLFY